MVIGLFPLPPLGLNRYLGEWFHPVDGQGTPTAEQIAEASSNCFTVMGIYIAFSVLALLTLCWQRRGARAS